VEELYAQRTGKQLNWKSAGEPDRAKEPFGDVLSYILLDHPVFQEIMLNPMVLALPTWKLGRNMIVHDFAFLMKGQGDGNLSLHADDFIAPPFSAHASSFNVTMPLTDYTMEAGPIAYVPGSQRLLRQPVGEARNQRTPVLARAGSLICFSSHCWHGSFPRQELGLRLNLVMSFARPHMRPANDYSHEATQDLINKHPPRFKTLIGIPSNTWGREGPVTDGSISLLGTTAFN